MKTAGQPLMGAERLPQIFVRSAAAVVLVAALGKWLMVVRSGYALDEVAPLFWSGVSNRILMLFVSMAEAALGLSILLFRIRAVPAANAFIVFGSTICCYRVMLWIYDIRWHCECLGMIADVMHLSDEQANTIAIGILVYVTAGSVILIYGPTIMGSKRPDSR